MMDVDFKLTLGSKLHFIVNSLRSEEMGPVP